ncbi:MAG TPA: hypothetical protein VFB96_06670 [Pirellulaceae bacterium]|nr:hypothetical protein [Pirellulaceae bacterium]
MRRDRVRHTEDPGKDSFLDVIANVVAILIILVMVVGSQAKQGLTESVKRRLEANSPSASAVASAKNAAATVESGLNELQSNIKRQQFEIAYRNAERDQIQKVVLLAEEQLARRREQMNDEQKARLDLEQQVLAAQRQLAKTQLALESSAKPPPAAIPHLPTPMATTVLTEEVHFRLLSGRLAYVPYTEMLARLQADAPNRIHRLKDAPRIEETLPVVQGFGGRYILRRVDEEILTKVGPARRSNIELEKIWFVDAEPNLGEPFEEAIKSNSLFRARLTGLDPQRTVITVWVYPDSFDQFRRLKEQLFKAGFLTAARPLPSGHPIGGAPDGTRSAAE